ncbi:YkgJ family cysteine cluster protein [Kaarinaea lacus]
MQCRAGCGACCIAPSITSTIPGMPNGKPAGVRCIHLDENHFCKLFLSPERPAVCARFQAAEDACGNNFDDALERLQLLEHITSNG